MIIKQEISLEDFEAWSGACATLETLAENGALSDAESFIVECLGEEITTTELNDFLWFEDEFLFESLGICLADDDEEEEEE